MKQKIQKQFSNLGNVWTGFLQYIKVHPLMSVLIAVILALVYAGLAFSDYYYIDAEIIINRPEYMYNWSQIGRFGLVWLKHLLGLAWFNPYFAGGLLLLILWLTAMVTGYLFTQIDERISTAAVGLFGLLYLIYPTYCEQFMFQFQAFEVVCALFLLAVADCYFVQFLKERNVIAFILSLIPTIIAFGVYQAMVNMQLCLYLGIFLFFLYRSKENSSVLRRNIIFTIVHFVVSYIIYSVIVKLFYSGSDYLTSQIAWGKGSIFGILSSILSYVKLILVGNDVFYTVSYRISVLLFAVVILMIIVKKRQKSLWYILSAVGLAVSPFFLSICTGIIVAYRIQLMLPLAGAVMWMFALHYIQTGKEAPENVQSGWRRSCATLVVLLGGLLIYTNAAPTMRIFYSHEVIGRADEIIASQITADLNEIASASEGKPVIIIGHREALTNASCYTKEDAASYMLMSAYEFDYVFEPIYFFSTYRILGYFRTLGFSYVEPTSGLMNEAYTDSADMPCWPLEGSVQEFNDYIIVKLSED